MKKNKKYSRHCICCEKKVELYHGMPEDGFTDTIQAVNGALVCRTYGNFGSSLYDPMRGWEHIEFYLCDDCAKAKGKFLYHVTYKKACENTSLRTFEQYLKDEEEASKKFANSKLGKRLAAFKKKAKENNDKR